LNDNSLPIANKKPLQKRYYAAIDIFITLIIRILENRFTNRILHNESVPPNIKTPDFILFFPFFTSATTNLGA